MNWTKNVNYKKGEKGFVAMNESAKDVQVLFLVSPEQKKIIDNYCSKEKISKGDFIRTAIKEYLEKKGVKTSIAPKEDKRQMKLYPDQEPGKRKRVKTGKK